MSVSNFLKPDFDSPLSAAIFERDREMMQRVRTAIYQKRVILAYQPIVQTHQMDQPAFYEGLLRVIDPDGSIIPASEFIAAAEATEIGRELDCLSIEMGLNELADHDDLRLSINMSVRSIGHQRWIEILKRGLAKDPTIAERLILEITESSAILMPDIVSTFMTELQSLGVSFALDDFGAGYTAFRYFKDFYFDIVKIDGEFIRGISHNPDNQVLTQALISIARHFDMFTVAELVETAEDAQYLSSIGVDCLQGHYFGTPVINPAWKTCVDRKVAL